MLSGKHLRVRVQRNRILPQYLDGEPPEWLGLAGQLIEIFRESKGRTRFELVEELAAYSSAGAEPLITQGLIKLLEDRCEYEVSSECPPEQVRELAFRLAAEYRKSAPLPGLPFPRETILSQVGEQLQITAEQADVALFADLKDEQRLLQFDDCSPEYLLRRYNVALAQAVLIRSTGVDVHVWGEPTERYRQLFRAIKFHKLICAIHTERVGYRLKLEGPLSLFSSTQKYGLQLAKFLPTLLHCRQFELHARVRWGAQRREREFVLSSQDGLTSHTPDFGQFHPPELDAFAESFRALTGEWAISSDPAPVSLEGDLWVPDFTLTNEATRRTVFLEVLGFWRFVSLESHLKKLRRVLPGQFLLALGEQNRADDGEDQELGPEIVRYKKTPSAAAILKALNAKA